MIPRPALTMGLLLGVLAAPAAALAEDDLCQRLSIPEGYGLTCTLERVAETDQWQAVVEPQEGAFAHLSRLTLEPVDEPVGSPAAWLRERVRLDLTGVADGLRDFANSADNPFAGSSLDPYLRQWIEGVDKIADLPLKSCAEPEQIAGGGWEIACEWRVLELQKLMTVRLVERNGQAYAITINSMNPRRMRHLVAIASSF